MTKEIVEKNSKRCCFKLFLLLLSVNPHRTSNWIRFVTTTTLGFLICAVGILNSSGQESRLKWDNTNCFTRRMKLRLWWYVRTYRYLVVVVTTTTKVTFETATLRYTRPAVTSILFLQSKSSRAFRIKIRRASLEKKKTFFVTAGCFFTTTTHCNQPPSHARHSS